MAIRQQLSINVIYYLSINVKTDTQEENFNYLYGSENIHYSLTPPLERRQFLECEC
jgi:hypothetical protein